MRNQGGAQHELLGAGLNQVNEACVAPGDARGQSDDLAEHLIQCQLRTYNPAHPVQYGRIGILPFQEVCRTHTIEGKSSLRCGSNQNFL